MSANSNNGWNLESLHDNESESREGKFDSGDRSDEKESHRDAGIAEQKVLWRILSRRLRCLEKKWGFPLDDDEHDIVIHESYVRELDPSFETSNPLSDAFRSFRRQKANKRKSESSSVKTIRLGNRDVEFFDNLFEEACEYLLSELVELERIVLLSRSEGGTEADTARYLGVSRNRIKSLSQSARKKVRGRHKQMPDFRNRSRVAISSIKRKRVYKLIEDFDDR